MGIPHYKFTSKPSAQRQTAPSPNASTALIGIANALKVTDDARICQQLQNILASRNENLAGKMVKVLMPQYTQQLLHPDHFVTYADNLDGELGLGFLRDGRVLGIDKIDLVRHIGVFGQSGVGKSTLMRNLILQIVRRGDIAQIVFDQKSENSDLVKCGADIIHWTDDKDNFLLPPEGVDIYGYLNNVSTILAEEMQCMDLGASICHDAIYRTYERLHVFEHWPAWDWERMRFPTMLDLHDTLESADFAKCHKARGNESRFSIIDKLSRINRELRPLICQRGFPIESFIRNRRTVVYDISGLSSAARNPRIMVMLVKLYLFLKSTASRGGCHAMIYIDESKNLLGKGRQDMFMVKELISVAREAGIGIVAADQLVSEISQGFFSNIGTGISFRQSDGNDIRRVGLSMGASPEQSRENFSLQAGEAIVRTLKAKDIVRIRIPVLRPKEDMARAEIRERMGRRLREFARNVIACSPANDPAVQGQSHKAEKQGTPDQQSHELLSSQEREFLDAVVKCFDRPVTKIYEDLSIGQSAGHRLKERLRKRGFLTQVATTLGKGGKQAVFVIPDPEACVALGLELGAGRGGALHRHYQQLFKEYAERHGHFATIEECLNGTSEGPDVGVHLKSGERIAVEIAITSKPSQEFVHIEKNSRLGYDRIVLSFVHKSVLQKTRAMAVKQYSEETIRKVSFCLVTDVQVLLEEKE